MAAKSTKVSLSKAKATRIRMLLRRATQHRRTLHVHADGVKRAREKIKDTHAELRNLRGYLAIALREAKTEPQRETILGLIDGILREGANPLSKKPKSTRRKSSR